MKYICTGRIHPERTDVSFSRIELKFAGGGGAVASCDTSQITVVVEDPSLDGWISARITAEGVANLMVGALGF
jgi:hypothetical protein